MLRVVNISLYLLEPKYIQQTYYIEKILQMNYNIINEEKIF